MVLMIIIKLLVETISAVTDETTAKALLKKLELYIIK